MSTPNARPLPLRLAAVALLAVLLAACGPSASDPTVAAIVNGEIIPVETVEERFESASANEQLAQQLEADESGDTAKQVQAQILSQLIQSQLLRQGAADLGIEVTDQDIATTREEVVEGFGGEEQFQQVVEQNQLSEEDVDAQLEEIAYQQAVETELTSQIEVSDAEIEQFYEENADGRFGEQISARHILVETEQEAEEALQRVQEGEDFAAVAEEVSTDPGSAANGGDLGQITRGQTVPEFEEAVFAAEEGDLVGPVETQFGFHIIEVTGKETPQLADVEEEIRDELLAPQRQEAVQSWLQEQVEGAEIEVNPRFGEWDADAGQVTTGDPLEAPTAPGAPTPGAPTEGAPPASEMPAAPTESASELPQ